MGKDKQVGREETKKGRKEGSPGWREREKKKMRGWRGLPCRFIDLEVL